MHLLINLAVIRLSLQIVIPGIMIIFKRQKGKHQDHLWHLISLQQHSLPGVDGRGSAARGRALISFLQVGDQ